MVASYLLAVLGGNASPSAADLKKILSAVGAEADQANLDKFLSEMDGKDVNEVLEAGQAKLASVPSGGGGGGGGGSGGGGGGGAAAAAPEPEEEPEEEEMEFDLFD